MKAQSRKRPHRSAKKAGEDHDHARSPVDPPPPPRQHLKLLVLSSVLFALWLGYLVWLALA